MIFDRLEHAARYRRLGERFALAFDALAGDVAGREPGRYELAGADVVALVQRYQTRPRASGRWEAHRKHIDIQYVAAGAEVMGHAQLADMRLDRPYDAADDVAFYAGEGDFVIVGAGRFMVFFPEDVHMPGLAWKQPEPVTKVVIKVRIDG